MGEEEEEGERGLGQPDPLQGGKGGKMDSIPGNPLGQGVAWSWWYRVAAVFLKIPH